MRKIIGIVALLAICLACTLAACTPTQCQHQFGQLHDKIEPTCLTDGTLAYKTCNLCGKNFDDEGNQLDDVTIKTNGHNFSKWKQTKVENSNEILATRVCSVCNFSQSKTMVETTFTVSYDLAGGTLYSDTTNPNTYKNTDDDIAIVSNPYKQGYVFTGWAHGDEEPNAAYVIESCTETNLQLVANYTIDTSTLYNGGNVDTLPKAVRDYLDSKNKAEYLYNYNADYEIGGDPQPVKFDWENANTSAKTFTLTIAYDQDFQNVFVNRQITRRTSGEYNFVPMQTYFYKITDNFGNIVKIDSFVINEPIRTIFLGTVYNVRDIGGYTTSQGTLRYGLAYRSPALDTIDRDGLDILLNQLGVKIDLDLRAEAFPGNVHPDLPQHIFPMTQWDYLFPDLNKNRPFDSIGANALKEVFAMLADKDNYPLIFHCAAGADRTGTLAFLLNGLLGVSFEDLAIDFEITSFYYGRRWRSDIVQDSNGNYVFDDSGVMMDNSSNLVAMGKVYNHLMSNYALPNQTLSDAIENYLISVIGVTQAQIDAIREIWIEPNTNTQTTSTQQYISWQDEQSTDTQKLLKTLHAPVVDTSQKRGLHEENVDC